MKRAHFVLATILLFTALFSANGAANVPPPDNVYKGASSFERNGVTYRLTWTARSTSAGLSGKEMTKVSYSVYTGDYFMHPRTLDGGTVIGCWDVPPAKVRWEPLGAPQAGWMVKLGGDCSGSLQSYKVHLAIPQKHKCPIATRYVTATFNAKETPLARWSEDEKRLRIWSSYEQWGRWRKSFEFLVPELREYFVGELAPYVLAR